VAALHLLVTRTLSAPLKYGEHVLEGYFQNTGSAVCDTLRLIDKNILQIEDNVKNARKYAWYINENSDYKVSPESHTPISSISYYLILRTLQKSVHLEAAKETGIWLTYAY